MATVFTTGLTGMVDIGIITHIMAFRPIGE